MIFAPSRRVVTAPFVRLGVCAGLAHRIDDSKQALLFSVFLGGEFSFVQAELWGRAIVQASACASLGFGVAAWANSCGRKRDADPRCRLTARRWRRRLCSTSWQPNHVWRTRSRAIRRANGTSTPTAIQHPGLRDRHQRQPRPDRHFKVKTDATAYGSTSTDWVSTAATARGDRDDHPSASLPQTQPACLDDATPGSSTAATGRVSASWAVPIDAVSGVYFAKLVRTDTRRREPHHLHRPRRRRSRRTSCSRRRTPLGRRTTSTAATASTRAARQRPRLQGELQPAVQHERGQRATDWLFGAEYPMIRWLEANGYDVSYSRVWTPTASGPASATTRFSCPSATTNTGPGTSGPMSRRRGTQASIWHSSAGTRCSGRRAGKTASMARQPLPNAGLLQGDAGEREDRPDVPSGRALGATRGSALPPTVDGPRTR